MVVELVVVKEMVLELVVVVEQMKAGWHSSLIIAIAAVITNINHSLVDAHHQPGRRGRGRGTRGWMDGRRGKKRRKRRREVVSSNYTEE